MTAPKRSILFGRKKKKATSKLPEESKVGKRLSDLTTRRVIILVLAMMFSQPFFTLNQYLTEPKSFKFGLETIRHFSDDTSSAIYKETWDVFVAEH